MMGSWVAESNPQGERDQNETLNSDLDVVRGCDVRPGDWRHRERSARAGLYVREAGGYEAGSEKAQQEQKAGEDQSGRFYSSSLEDGCCARKEVMLCFGRR